MTLDQCKAGHCYWITFEFKHKTYRCPARLSDDRVTFMATDVANKVWADRVLSIGPEIIQPPEPREPGIYRVRWQNELTVAELRNSGEWWLMGSVSVFKEDSFQSIGEYLGPIKPPTE